MNRRTYYIRFEIRKIVGEVPRETDPICFAKSIRANLGIFQSGTASKWLDKVKSAASENGWKIDGPWGRHTRTDWPYVAYTYGTFDENGKGRAGSSLWRLPTQVQPTPESK